MLTTASAPVSRKSKFDDFGAEWMAATFGLVLKIADRADMVDEPEAFTVKRRSGPAPVDQRHFLPVNHHGVTAVIIRIIARAKVRPRGIVDDRARHKSVKIFGINRRQHAA